MPILLRKADVLRRFRTYAGVARAFVPILGHPLTRQAPTMWGEYIPELRARELIEYYADLRDDLVDTSTGLSAREVRDSQMHNSDAAV